MEIEDKDKRKKDEVKTDTTTSQKVPVYNKELIQLLHNIGIEKPKAAKAIIETIERTPETQKKDLIDAILISQRQQIQDTINDEPARSTKNQSDSQSQIINVSATEIIAALKQAKEPNETTRILIPEGDVTLDNLLRKIKQLSSKTTLFK